jgi:hypothetical protein
VAAGMTVMAKTQRAHQNDVTCPPPKASIIEGGDIFNLPARRVRG